jgi:hypothetical protein
MSTKAVATDKRSNQYVTVVAGYYSVNGCEPQPLPAKYEGRDARSVARDLLRELRERDKD